MYTARLPSHHHDSLWNPIAIISAPQPCFDPLRWLGTVAPCQRRLMSCANSDHSRHVEPCQYPGFCNTYTHHLRATCRKSSLKYQRPCRHFGCIYTMMAMDPTIGGLFAHPSITFSAHYYALVLPLHDSRLPIMRVNSLSVDIHTIRSPFDLSFSFVVRPPSSRLDTPRYVSQLDYDRIQSCSILLYDY
jgi:hypothetical protein